VPPTGAGEVVICFDIFLEDPGKDLQDWPGRQSKGTQLMGRLALPRGGTACVVASVSESQKQTFSGSHDLSPEQKEEVKRRIREASDPRMILYGETDDGAIALWFGRLALAESSD
jgi:hypothetical protein